MQEHEQQEEFSLKNYFVPLTNLKAIHFIILIGLIVFINGLFNGFVADDDSQIIQNANVHTIANIRSFFTGGTFFNGGGQLLGIYYKPLMVTVFASIYSLFGPNAFMFHFVQMVFYIANACILFFVLEHFFKKPLAFVLSLLFLVHPINSEVALYVSNMQDVLFFFFGILSLLFLIKLTSNKFLFLVPLCFLLSLFSKETGVLFIITSLLYTFIFQRKRFLLLLSFTAPVVALYVLLRVTAIGIFIKPSASPLDSLTFIQRLINVPANAFFYLQTFFFPLNLSVLHDWAYKSITFNNFFLPLIIDILFVIGISVIGIVLYKKSRKSFTTYLFFSLWFLFGLLLHLQIIPLDTTAAERWFYFPIVGLLGMIGVLVSLYKDFLRNKWNFIVIVILVILLSVRTIIRTFDFRDNMTLYTHDLTVSKNSFGLENQLGYEYIKQGQYAKAKPYIEDSIKIYPHFINYNNLGMVYVGLNNYPKAKEAYLKALQFGDYYLVDENLAGLALVYGNPKENIQFIHSALNKYPHDPKLWLYLAVLEYVTKDTASAKISISQAYMYDQSAEVINTYNIIMNNQPLNLNILKTPNH